MNIFGGSKKVTKQDALKWGTYGITGLILFGKATNKVTPIRAFFESLKYLDDE